MEARDGINVTPLVDNQLLPGLSGVANGFTYYKITVPPGRATLDVTISGGTGDADLYVREGTLPTLSLAFTSGVRSGRLYSSIGVGTVTM